MQKANVLIAEDRPHIRELVRYWLDDAGHTVVREAATLPEALDAVDNIAAGDMDCDVVILDGDLGGRPVRGHDDAQEILSKIREYRLGVKVIGFSSRGPLSEEGVEVDVDFDKNESLSRMPELIASF